MSIEDTCVVEVQIPGITMKFDIVIPGITWIRHTPSEKIFKEDLIRITKSLLSQAEEMCEVRINGIGRDLVKLSEG